MKEPIELAGFSRYRSHLMGVAMIIVMLFHTGGMRHDTIAFCISRCGNVGVDMFLFLSGIGLWYSWCRLCDDNALASKCGTAGLLRRFFINRYARVYPAWLTIAILYYVPKYIGGSIALDSTVTEILFNSGFWKNGELNFWFVPAIMMLYTVAPAYMLLIRRYPSYRMLPVAAMILCVLIQYFAPLHSHLGHLEIFFSRIPIFLLGINAGRFVRERHSLAPQAIWMIIAVFIMCAVACVNFEAGLRGRFPLFIERMVYIPFSITGMLLLCRLFPAMPSWINRLLVFIGGISLELYLVHIEFVMRHVMRYKLGYWLTAIITLCVSAVIAWLLHKVAVATANQIKRILINKE